MKLKLLKVLLAFSLLALLGACGGGGGGAAPPAGGSSDWDQMVWDQDNWS